MRSPRGAGMGRDGSGRRAIPHAIRRQAIPHATPILPAVSGDERYRTRHARRHAIRRRALPHATSLTDAIRRRAIPAATDLTARDPATNLTARDPATDNMAYDDLSCPNIPRNARTMFGRCSDDARICPDMPDDVSLLGLSGDRVTG